MPHLHNTALAAALALVACQQPARELPLAPPRAEPAPPPAPPPEATPIIEHHYADGYAQFVDRIDLPNTTFRVRGAMTVTVYPSYVRIDKGGDAVWVVPRERLIYVGQEM